jgi:hypothetical protein
MTVEFSGDAAESDRRTSSRRRGRRQSRGFVTITSLTWLPLCSHLPLEHQPISHQTTQLSTQPSSCLATTVDPLLLPDALPPRLHVLRRQLLSRLIRHPETIKPYMLTIWYRLAQLPLSPTHLKTALNHRQHKQLLSKALVAVSSARWQVPLRKFFHVYFGYLKGLYPDCADVCMTAVSLSVPLSATQSVVSSVAVLQHPPSSQLRLSPTLPTTAPTLRPTTRLPELVRLMSPTSVAAWTRTRAV